MLSACVSGRQLCVCGLTIRHVGNYCQWNHFLPFTLLHNEIHSKRMQWSEWAPFLLSLPPPTTPPLLHSFKLAILSSITASAPKRKETLFALKLRRRGSVCAKKWMGASCGSSIWVRGGQEVAVRRQCCFFLFLSFPFSPFYSLSFLVAYQRRRQQLTGSNSAQLHSGSTSSHNH